MLSQFQEVVNSLTVTTRVNMESIDISGRDVFPALFERLVIYIPNPQKKGELVPNRGMKAVLNRHGLEGYMNSETPTQFDLFQTVI